MAPRRLVILEHSESALFQIEKELLRIRKQDDLANPVVAVLGSVLDRSLMERTMCAYAVQTVYHAAAYKHVGLVEKNVISGVRTNVFGTLHAAQAALAAGVSNFVLISTDKAVRAHSVMGASKRLAEMVLQALQEQTDRTRFSVVRFGNVLVSSGSVVPLFLEQIAEGGPVTVTHPDATRYFMTISEAVELLLQAGSMATGGDIFLLDMGKPTNIYELARKTIRLAGHRVRDEFNPHGDIEIHFTGLRAGEKLNEEPLACDASSGTEHRKIMCTLDSHPAWSELRPALDKLAQACEDYDYAAIRGFLERLAEGADLAEKLLELPSGTNVLPMPIRRRLERPT